MANPPRDMCRRRASCVEIARPELGHSVHADVRGLQPGREYVYRLHAAGDVSHVP